MIKFKALRVKEIEGKYVSSFENFNIDDLPKNDILIKVLYSSINFKDALSWSGNKGVTKVYPHTPGIDSVGEVMESNTNKYKKGDRVIVCGYDLGMNTWGAYSEYISVPEKWVIKLHQKLGIKESMEWGTAGITAAMSVYELLNSNANIPKNSNIVVSGATGGVGIISCLILVKLGYNVTAITSKTDKRDFFINNGIKEIMSREEFLENSKKPLLKEIYEGGIDVSGGEILDSILKKIKYKGAVTCCGLVNSNQLNTNVFPFILRGVRLIGIDSVEGSTSYKEKMWELVSNEFNVKLPKEIVKEIKTEELPENLERVLNGKSFGRVVVNIGVN